MILEFPSKPKESKWAKKCPLCGGQMNFHTTEAMWKCYNCGNEEPEKEDTAGAGDRNDASKSSAAPEPVPTAGSATPPEHKPTPAASEPFGKRPLPGTKTCPVCHKQMNMHEEDKTWNCPFCNYLIREF